MKHTLLATCLSISLCCGFANYATAQRLLKGIDIGGQPGIPAANTSTNMVYVPNTGLNTLTVISGDSASVVANIAMNDVPFAAAVNPTTNLVYVTLGNGVAVVDGSTNTLVTTVAAEGAPGWIAVNPVTNFIYFSTYSTDFSVMDGSTNEIVDTIKTGLGPYSEGIAVDSDTNRIYVTLAESGKGSLMVINGDTNKFTVFPITGAFQPLVPVVDPKHDRVYVPDNEFGHTYVINGSTGGLIETVLPGYYPPIALNASGSSIAASGFADGTTAIAFFSVQKFAELGSPVNFPPRQDPLSIAAGSHGRYYVTFLKNNSVGVVAGPK